MPANKKHHYVPQFYLRSFGIGNSISLFNVPNRRHIPIASIPHQCQRTYLYGSDNKKERELAKLEGRASNVIRSILNSISLPACGSDAHRALADFIAVQRGRTPGAAAEVQLTRDKMYRALARDLASRNGLREGSMDDFAPPPGPDPVALSLRRADGAGAVLVDLDMRLLIASSRAFITSDLPVVLYNQWAQHCKTSGVTGV